MDFAFHAFQPSSWPLHFSSPLLVPSFVAPENYVHWTETAEAHIYTADLPGVRREEIKVEVEDSQFIIIRTEAVDDDVAATMPAKTFMRKFRLPRMVDIDGISAGYEDGVLTVTVPRSFVRGRFRIINAIDLSDRHNILAPAA